MPDIKINDIIHQFPDSAAYKARQASRELSSRTVVKIISEYDIDMDRINLILLMEDESIVKFPVKSKALEEAGLHAAS